MNWLQELSFLPPRPTLEKITLDVRKLNLADYEAYHYDKDKLREVCKCTLTELVVEKRCSEFSKFVLFCSCFSGNVKYRSKLRAGTC